MEPLLEVSKLAVDIGQFHILSQVDFRVPQNEVTVLMGRNGAGKTTTLRTIMGFLKPQTGEVRLRSERIDGLSAWKIPRLGVGYVPEDGNIFANLTIEENLRLGLRDKTMNAETAMGEVEALFPDLKAARHRLAGQLSGGQRQMLAIGSVLMNVPDLLVIDEPSKGLSPLFVQKLGEALQAVCARTTVLLVEQNFELATRVGTSYVLIEDGATVGTGPMQELADSPELQGRYLGVQVAAEGLGG